MRTWFSDEHRALTRRASLWPPLQARAQARSSGSGLPAPTTAARTPLPATRQINPVHAHEPSAVHAHEPGAPTRRASRRSAGGGVLPGSRKLARLRAHRRVSYTRRRLTGKTPLHAARQSIPVHAQNRSAGYAHEPGPQARQTTPNSTRLPASRAEINQPASFMERGCRVRRSSARHPRPTPAANSTNALTRQDCAAGTPIPTALRAVVAVAGIPRRSPTIAGSAARGLTIPLVLLFWVARAMRQGRPARQFVVQARPRTAREIPRFVTPSAAIAKARIAPSTHRSISFPFPIQPVPLRTASQGFVRRGGAKGGRLNKTRKGRVRKWN